MMKQSLKKQPIRRRMQSLIRPYQRNKSRSIFYLIAVRVWGSDG